MADKIERKSVNFYAPLMEEQEEPPIAKIAERKLARKAVPAAAPEMVLGFKSAATTATKTVFSTKVDTGTLETVRDFCHGRRITFASFVEVALSEELRKQLGNQGAR